MGDNENVSLAMSNTMMSNGAHVHVLHVFNENVSFYVPFLSSTPLASFTSLTSFTPLVIRHSISRVQEKKSMICHSRRSRHSRHSSFVIRFQGYGKMNSWLVTHVAHVIRRLESGSRIRIFSFYSSHSRRSRHSWFVVQNQEAGWGFPFFVAQVTRVT